MAVRRRIRDLISMWADGQEATGVLCGERNYNGNEITVRDLTAAVSAGRDAVGGDNETPG